MGDKESLATRVEQDVIDAVEELGRDRDVSKSKATEEAVLAGLARLGYRDGGPTPTRSIIGYVASGTFFAGTTLLLLSLLGSISLFGAGMGVLSTSLGLTLFGRYVVPRFEPELTNRLPRIEVNRYGR